MKARLLLPLLLATLAACTPQEYDSPEMMVVEGWIESGAAPVVKVTTSIAPTAEKQSLSSLADHIEKWARVAINDGTKEVVLTGKVSTEHIPSYIYTTGRMFGEPGKTYTITVDTDDFHCTASTVIPGRSIDGAVRSALLTATTHGIAWARSCDRMASSSGVRPAVASRTRTARSARSII